MRAWQPRPERLSVVLLFMLNHCWFGLVRRATLLPEVPLCHAVLQIRGPNEQEMWAVRQRSQAHFHVVAAQDGLHSICFENRLSSRAVKTVAFSVHVGDDVFKELAQHEHLTPLEQEISQLADNLQTVVDEQHYYWSRERRHRDTSESTNARVLWFSVAETLVILAMAGWQFWSLRAFISKTLTF